MKTKLYVYERSFEIGERKLIAVCGIKETNISAIIEKIIYLFEWFSVGFLFYLNSVFIHSRLFSIFIFICGIILLFTIGTKKRLSTKEEFLKKVNDILPERKSLIDSHFNPKRWERNLDVDTKNVLNILSREYKENKEQE